MLEGSTLASEWVCLNRPLAAVPCQSLGVYSDVWYSVGVLPDVRLSCLDVRVSDPVFDVIPQYLAGGAASGTPDTRTYGTITLGVYYTMKQGRRLSEPRRRDAPLQRLLRQQSRVRAHATPGLGRARWVSSRG